MIEQVRVLFQERGFASAVIIDDAFDDRPRPGDVDDAHWDRFFDDLNEEGERELSEAYGVEAYEEGDDTVFRRDQTFIDALWHARSTMENAAALFEDFERMQDRKRTELSPLCQLLETDLGMRCEMFGRDVPAELAEASIVFLDLFLGAFDDDGAVGRAIDRIKGIVANRPQTPPSIVLLSASPRLEELGPRLRDEAGLLGCQFRMVKKSALGDVELMTAKLYELALSYPDALKLNAFLLAWDRALNGARENFVRSIRTLDFADYANMQELILEAEGEPVGDYVLDLYDLHLHNVLEGDAGLIRAAKELNTIAWNEYPPAQFMPSPEAIEIMDGALFHNQVRTDVEAEFDANLEKVRLGDVFLAPPTMETGDAQEVDADPAPRVGTFTSCSHKHVTCSMARRITCSCCAGPFRLTAGSYTTSKHDYARQ